MSYFVTVMPMKEVITPLTGEINPKVEEFGNRNFFTFWI